MKICVNCASINSNGMKACVQCGADLGNAIETKWNDFKGTAAIQKQIRENEAVFGKYKKPVRSSAQPPDKDNVARCPKCGSPSLSADKKGFGVGKAVIGAAAVGNPIGLVAGNIGAKKVRVTCLKCGHQFWAGK